MALLCPDCAGRGALLIEAFMEIPPDSRSDEITIQLVKCGSCEFIGAAVYEESRRGRLDDESVDHYGFRLERADWERLAKMLKACPRPRDTKCKCRSHTKLNPRSEYGRWQGLNEFNPGKRFTVIYQR